MVRVFPDRIIPDPKEQKGMSAIVARSVDVHIRGKIIWLDMFSPTQHNAPSLARIAGKVLQGREYYGSSRRRARSLALETSSYAILRSMLLKIRTVNSLDPNDPSVEGCQRHANPVRQLKLNVTTRDHAVVA